MRRQGAGDYRGGSTTINGGDGSWFSQAKPKKPHMTAKAYAKPEPTAEERAERAAHDRESLGAPKLLRKADIKRQRREQEEAIVRRQAKRFAKNRRADEVADAKARGAEKRARQERIARRASRRKAQ